MRRIGVLTVFSKDDPEGQRRVTALQQKLRELGWADGRNVRIEFVGLAAIVIAPTQRR